MFDRLAITVHSWMAAWPLFAQVGNESAKTPEPPASNVLTNVAPNMLLAIAYTAIGMVLFGLCVWLIVKIAPFSVRKEIEEDQNIALGIIMGSLILGIAIILAAAIHG